MKKIIIALMVFTAVFCYSQAKPAESVSIDQVREPKKTVGKLVDSNDEIFKNTGEIIAAISLFIVFLGLILGFSKFWYSRKVRIKIIPQLITSRRVNNETGKELLTCSSNKFSKDYIFKDLALEIRNLSSFPVKIRMVGFKLKKGSLVIPEPIISKGEELPIMLESRDNITVYTGIDDLLRSLELKNIKSAYVETSCGETFKGKSKALKELIKYFK